MANKDIENLELQYVSKSKASVVVEPRYLPPPDNVGENISFYEEVMAKESKMQKLKQLSKKNPFVPIGVVLTGGILLNGIWAMKRGDKAKSQRMMRYRVAAQGITLMAVLGGTLLTQYLFD